MFFIAKAARSQHDTFAKVFSEFAKVMFFLSKDLTTYFYMRLPRKIKRGVRERFAKVTY